MSFGIVEIIQLLLGLQGFGLQPNPKAPSPDASLQYAIADADVVGHFDAASVIPGNYKVLTQLPDQPAIKSSPELAKVVRQLINEIEGPRGMAKSMVGLDPVTDVSDLTAFFQLQDKHDPNFVVAVHGKFSSAIVDKIAKLTGKASIKSGGGTWVDSGDGNGFGITKDGTLIAGTATLIKDRMADTWKAPAHAAGSNLGYAAEVLGGKPVFAVVLTMSQAARTQMLAMHDNAQNFLTDVIKRHKVASFAIYHDGIGWTWGDSNQSGLDSMASISDGVVDLLRAGQIAPRGFAKIVLGGLESYRGVNKQIDAIVDHKTDITKIVNTYTGDGAFKVKVDKDSKALKLAVRLTGKSVSEVVPVGVLVPMAAVGAFFAMRSGPSTTTGPTSVPPTSMWDDKQAVPAPTSSTKKHP